MNSFPLKQYRDNISDDIDFSSAKFVWIPQGVACQEAELGVSNLMKEILSFIKDAQENETRLKSWKVCKYYSIN